MVCIRPKSPILLFSCADTVSVGVLDSKVEHIILLHEVLMNDHYIGELSVEPWLLDRTIACLRGQDLPLPSTPHQ